MSTKLAWVRSFPSDCLAETNGMKAFQIATYVTLKWHMRKSGEPIFYDQDKLAHSAGCSKKVFNKALEFLLRDKKIICLEDGRLWSLQVEEELNNSNENLNKFSERAQKAAQAKWAKHHKEKTISDDQNAKHDANGMLKDAKHDAYDATSNATSNAYAMLDDANHNHNHIYNKKNNTIVLSKKETEFEDLETTDLIEEPIEVDAIESQSDQITTSSDNQPPIHEQTSVSKKAKRSKAKDGFLLPENFEPDLQYAIDKGLTHDEALLEFERFTNHWKANPCSKAKKRNWQKTWYNWVTNPQCGLLAKKKEKLEREKQYAKQRIEKTEQQRGQSYRVAQYMSDVKNSDSPYKFLFEDVANPSIPLEIGAKTVDCRSGENYFISQ